MSFTITHNLELHKVPLKFVAVTWLNVEQFNTFAKVMCGNVVIQLFLDESPVIQVKFPLTLNVASRRQESCGYEVLRFPSSIMSAFTLRRASECKASLFWLVKSNTLTGRLAPEFTAYILQNSVTCHYRPNMTANNCLSDICMSLLVLLNTPLSNRAPRHRHYFKLFADSMVGWNKTIMRPILLDYGVLWGLSFHWKLRS